MAHAYDKRPHDAGAALKARDAFISYLIAPFQHIFLALLDLIVDVNELDDAVLSDVVGILLGVLPVQWRSL